MVRLALVSMLLVCLLLAPVGADKAQVSPWLIQNRGKLVDNARIAKLAMLCQKWPAGFVQIAVDILLREHAGPGAPFDRDYASRAIVDGENYARIDFKAAPAQTCKDLVPAELAATASYFAERKVISVTGHIRQ